MAEIAVLPRPPETPNAEASQKLQRKVGPREVKGFYYHAAEYHRQKQSERKLGWKILGGLAEPFLIHIRAARLKHAANKYGGRMQGWILDNNFAKKALEGNFSEKDAQEFKAKTQLHTVFEKYQVSKEDEKTARSVLQDVFSKKGELSDEEIYRLQEESGMNEEDIRQLASVAQENAGAYLTAEEMKGKVGDEILFGGLTPEQVELAKKVYRSALISTGIATLKYGTLLTLGAGSLGILGAGGLVSSAFGTGGGIALNTGLSAGMRWSAFSKEGATYAINASKGIENKQHLGKWGRWLNVDWNAEHKGWQMTRAIGFGVALGFAFRFLPGIVEHGGGDLLQHFHGAPTGPDGSHHLVGSVDTVKAPQVGTNHTAVVGSHAPGNLESVQANPAHESLYNYEQSVNVHYLPDTPNHDWQELHTIAQQDSKGNAYLKVSYLGQDDGMKQHFIDVMIPDKNGQLHHVFLDNNATFALSGEHANDPVAIYGLVNGQVQQIDTIHSINLAHELGLTQGKIDNFANLSEKANQGGLWHGTQNASDLQTIMADRGLYNNGIQNGNYLWGARMGGGYFKGGQFYIGASNHYYATSLLQQDVLKTNFPGLSPLAGDTDDIPFTSAAAPELNWVDNHEDAGLEWLRTAIFRGQLDGPIHALDQATDYGLNMIDWGVRDTQEAFHYSPYFGALVGALEASPYAFAGVIGYYYGKRRAEGKVGKRGKALARTAEVAAIVAAPGLAAAAALGRMIAYVKNRKGKGGEKAAKKTEEKGTHDGAPVQQAPGSQAVSAVVPPVQAPAINDQTAATTANGLGDQGATPPIAPASIPPTETIEAAAPAGQPPLGVIAAPLPTQKPTQPTAEPLASIAATEAETSAAPVAPVTSAAAVQPSSTVVAAEAALAFPTLRNELLDANTPAEKQVELAQELEQNLRAQGRDDANLSQTLERITEKQKRNEQLSPEDMESLASTVREVPSLSQYELVKIYSEGRAALDGPLSRGEAGEEGIQTDAALLGAIYALPAGRAYLGLQELHDRNKGKLIDPAEEVTEAVRWAMQRDKRPESIGELTPEDLHAVAQVVFGESPTPEQEAEVKNAYENVPSAVVTTPDGSLGVRVSQFVKEHLPEGLLAGSILTEAKIQKVLGGNPDFEKLLKDVLQPIVEKLKPSAEGAVPLVAEEVGKAVTEESTQNRQAGFREFAHLVRFADILHRLSNSSESAKLPDVITKVRQIISSEAKGDALRAALAEVEMPELTDFILGLGEDILPFLPDLLAIL